MRLLEDIRNGEGWVFLGPHLKGKLESTQFVVADDVTQYFFAINDKENWKEEDFPNVAPPFDNFWIETKRPTHILSEEFGLISWDPNDPGASRPSRWGAIFLQVPKEKLLTEPRAARYPGPPIGFFTLEDLATFRWLYEIILFVEYPGTKVCPIWAWSMPVKEDGSMWSKYDKITNSRPCGYSYSLLPSAQAALIRPGGLVAYQSYRSSAHTMLNPLLLAICFMHCKNVEMVTVRPPEKLKKRNTQRGRSMFSYRMVQVGAIRKIIEASRKPGDTDISMALNRCRGHFKTYTEERPLLGRAVGTYFWNEQLRGGKKKKAVVLHDYKVTPGKL